MVVIITFRIDWYCGLVYIGQWQLEQTWQYTERRTERVGISALIGCTLRCLKWGFSKPPTLWIYKPVCPMCYLYLCYEATKPWRSVLDKRLCSELCRKFHTIYRTLGYIIMFTSDHQFSVTWARWIQSTRSNHISWRWILIQWNLPKPDPLYTGNLDKRKINFGTELFPM